MPDQDQRVSIIAWPPEAARLEHVFKAEMPCPLSISFEPSPANVTLSTNPEQPLQVAMNMTLAAREPVPVCIALCEPICARSDYTVGIQIFGNPVATINITGMTRLFACGERGPA